jgi:hypothetical protein
MGRVPGPPVRAVNLHMQRRARHVLLWWRAGTHIQARYACESGVLHGGHDD